MNKKYAFLTMNQLKIIAMAAMLIDHFAFVMLEGGIGLSGGWYGIDRVMRGIGRIAFPIFCFTIVEGFQKTHDAKEYLKRILIFALISEIPFDLAFRGTLFAPDYQNVFWTLGFGLGALILYEERSLNPWTRMIGIAACLIVPLLVHTDYSCFGVLAIMLMYQFRGNPVQSCMVGFAVLMLQNPSEIWAVFGFLLLFLYNGERGRGNKLLFYGFYPLHLLILVALKPVICGWLSSLMASFVIF